MKGLSVNEFESNLKREQVSRWINVLSVEKGVFILKDGGVGFGYELTPLLGVKEKLEESLESLYNLLPPGGTLQISLWAFPLVDEVIEVFKKDKIKAVDGLEKEIVENYAKFFLSKKWEEFSPNFLSTLKNYRLFLFVKLWGKEKTFSPLKLLSDIFSKEAEKEIENYRLKISRAKELKSKFSGGLKAAGFSFSELDTDRLIEFFFRIFNPDKSYEEIPKYRGGDISEYMVSNDTVIRIEEDYIKVNQLYGRNLSVKAFPEEWSLAESFEFIGKEMGGETFFGVPYVIYLNAVKLPEKEKKNVIKRASLVLNQHLPESLFPKLAEKKKDLVWAVSEINKGKELWHVNFGVFVFAKDLELLNTGIQRFKTYFRSMGFFLQEDKYINFPVFMSILPFGYDLKVAEFLKRGKIVFTDSVVVLSPIFADWKGTHPKLILVSPRGQIVGFDFFKSPGGYNSFVVGRTRSGKSVFLQLVALTHYLSGGHVWIIDIGRSYERLCHMLDGEFIEIRLDNPVCLNPFSKIEDWEMLEEYLEFLVDFVYMLGAPKDRKLSDEIEKLMKGYIDEAIKESFTKYGQETCIDTIKEELENLFANDPRVKDFVVSLKRYTSEGTFGAFFNGESSLELSGLLTVFENDTVENIPELRDPAMMLMIFSISRNIYLGKPEKKHLVIIDEAHKFLGNPKVDIFIEQAYRRMAKHGAGIIIGTQGFEDLYGGETKNRAGRVIVQNSFWKFFFTQTDTSRTALRNSKMFNLSDYAWELMNSVHVMPGEYSECFLLAEGFYAKLRVVLDPFLKAMFFTDDATRKKIYDLVEQGYSWTQAVKIVSEEKK
ncbi:MAG TPA: hypothetical protein EYH58_02625 [Aquifex aeolicus]|nr:hypothetical protein [Aquifex aeolicus]